MSKKIHIVLFLFLMTCHAFSQESIMMKGYVKGMTSMQSTGNGTLSIENTIHNRIDMNWYTNNNLTFTVGLRNRVVAGNNVSLIPNYGDYISRDAGYFDLSWIWAENDAWIGLSQLDRLLIDYSIGNLQITVGRQRINWGQSFVWNPNDLFNTYSYFDFDYEEKPGSDAVRLQYYIGESTKIELSTSLNSEKKMTSIGLFRWNTYGYDIQFIGGIYTETDYIIGGGWSGSIAGGGFSGEVTYFHPMDKNEEEGAITLTVHYDYTFPSSLNIQFETLYNGFGADEFSSGLGDIIFMDLTPKNLFPTKVGLFSSGSYDISPLFRVMLAGMYGPEGNFVYVGPTLTYSMTNTLELAAIGQYYSMDTTDESLADSGSALFVRLKWSF